MPAKKSAVTSPWAAIDAIVQAGTEPVGNGWFTVAEYVERYGGRYNSAYRKLAADARFEKWTGSSARARHVITKFRLK